MCSGLRPLWGHHRYGVATTAMVRLLLLWCSHCGQGAILWLWHGCCGECAAPMAAVLSSWPFFCHYGHGSGYYGYYGHNMTTIAMVWPLCQRCGHHDCGMVIMAVARSLWPWCSPYGCGTAPIAMVRPLWVWCHCYGCGATAIAEFFALVAQIMTWLFCQQLQTYHHFCHQDSHGWIDSQEAIKLFTRIPPHLD